MKFRYFGEPDWYKTKIHGYQDNDIMKEWCDNHLKGLYTMSYSMAFDEVRWEFKHRIDAIRFVVNWGRYFG